MKHNLADCDNCSLKGERYVPTVGPEDASLVIVGEAPGYRETVAGKPFVGNSGKLLDTVLSHYGINRKDVKLTNTVACRPPLNATPTKKDIACCAPRLTADVAPASKILTLGNTATAAIMGKSVKITSFRGGPPKRTKLYPNAVVVPTFHPAACLRNGDSFPSMVHDIGKITGDTLVADWNEPVFKVFNDRSAAEALKQISRIAGEQDTPVVIDIETEYDKDASFEHPRNYRLLCIGVCWEDGKAIVIGEEALKLQIVRDELKRFLDYNRIIAHNGKFDLAGLTSITTGASLWFDTMLASYCLDERQGYHGLKYIAQERLGAPAYEDEIKGFRTWADIPTDSLYKYNAYDVVCTWMLYKLYEKELEDNELRPLHDFLVKISNAIRPVELHGLGVDLELLDSLNREYEAKLETAENFLYKWVNNPRSVPQVKIALEALGYNVESTDKETLQGIYDRLVLNDNTDSDDFAFVAGLLEYRKDQKLHGTYVKGLRKRLYEGRVYPTYLLHGTTTGRPSCRNPNVLNIPRGSTIRSLFVPRKGNCFIQADYSQIEYRVVASLAKEPYLQEIFNDPTRDVFGELAQSMFGEGWNKAHRQIVKRVVHGSNYGMQAETMSGQIKSDAKQLAEQLGVEVNVDVSTIAAGRYQKEYFKTIPKVREWQKSTISSIFTEEGDLTTAFGRHRRYGLITNENKHDIEKEGLAFVPQSTASDICMSAVIALSNALPEGAQICLTVYDSIMVECKIEQEDEVKKLMEDIMVQAGRDFSDYLDFRVDIKTSTDSWGALSD